MAEWIYLPRNTGREIEFPQQEIMPTCRLVDHHGEMGRCLVVLYPSSVDKRQLPTADQVFDLQYQAHPVEVDQFRNDSDMLEAGSYT